MRGGNGVGDGSGGVGLAVVRAIFPRPVVWVPRAHVWFVSLAWRLGLPGARGKFGFSCRRANITTENPREKSGAVESVIRARMVMVIVN